MDLESGKSVRIKHFAGKFCNKGEIVENAGAIVTIKPEKPLTVFSFFEEDPLVLVYEKEEKYFVCQCSIISIDYMNSTFNILLENSEEFSSRRKEHRYPTSLYGIVLNSPGKETVFVNNISSEGINLKTKLHLNINEKIELEATIDGTYIFVSGYIKWKREQNNFFEYGIFIEESFPEMKSMLDKIKHDQLISIRNLKYEHSLINSI
jgi:hypothetical protein